MIDGMDNTLKEIMIGFLQGLAFILYILLCNKFLDWLYKRNR